MKTIQKHNQKDIRKEQADRNTNQDLRDYTMDMPGVYVTVTEKLKVLDAIKKSC